jgi:hypothetical protein
MARSHPIAHRPTPTLASRQSLRPPLPQTAGHTNRTFNLRPSSRSSVGKRGERTTTTPCCAVAVSVPEPTDCMATTTRVRSRRGTCSVQCGSIRFYSGPTTTSSATRLSRASRSLPTSRHPEKTFTVRARGRSKDNIYIQAITLNGRPHRSPLSRHADIVAGGILELKMGSTPATGSGRSQ